MTNNTQNPTKEPLMDEESINTAAAEKEIEVEIIEGEQIDEPTLATLHQKHVGDLYKNTIYRILIGVLIGLFFGIVMEKSKVNLPGVIRLTFLFENLIMLKLFMAASATGAVVVSLLVSMGLYKRDPGSFHVPAVFIGAFILGVGMAISGSCPGTMGVQVGSGLYFVWIVALGAMAGATTFSYFSQQIHDSKFYNTWTKGPLTLDGMLGVEPHHMWKVGIPFAVVMYGGVALFEHLSPSSTEIAQLTNFFINPDTIAKYVSNVEFYTTNKFIYTGIVGGLIIGALQLPTVILSGGLLGASSTYVAVSGHTVRILSNNKIDVHAIPYWKRIMYSPKSAQQFGMALGAAFGGYLSMMFTEAQPIQGTMDWASILMYFMGGFLFLFGARLAAGCTSGNGLSGTAQLQMKGFVAAAGIFAGGISASFVMKAIGIFVFPYANFAW